MKMNIKLNKYLYKTMQLITHINKKKTIKLNDEEEERKGHCDMKFANCPDRRKVQQVTKLITRKKKKKKNAY